MSWFNKSISVFTQSANMRWLKYGVVLFLLWILLAQGDPGSWVIGIIVIPLATWCVFWLFPMTGEQIMQQHISLKEILRFIPFFLIQSLKGGYESALFAVDPRRSLQPSFIEYVTQLPAGRPRLLFINVVSLLPGTVSAGWCGAAMTIHVLNTQADNHHALQQCEMRIAQLFGLDFVSSDMAESSSNSNGEQR